MEHEVVVPMPAEPVRQALQDPALLARCVPGLSTEPAAAGRGPADEISGRLRLRIGTSTITYKGVLSLIEGREGVLTVFAEGQEARGSGEASATVRVSVADGTEGGTSLVRFTGDLSATGRLAEFDDETLAAAGRRLLDRFVAALAAPEGAAEAEPEDDEEEPTEPAEVVEGSEDDRAAADAESAEAVEAAENTDGIDAAEASEAAEEETGATVHFLEDRQDEPGDDLDDDLSDLIAFSDADAERFGLPTGDRTEHPGQDDREGSGDSGSPTGDGDPSTELPAELPFEYEQEPVLSGPVRRSIVGRSAEEVDHAPPRGRYAPALPARSARARAASRWGGEAGGIVVPGPGGRNAVPWVIGGGVALLGGAVVLVRALRRR
ncbi:SRPBCC family protein [Kitasatospora sp. NPDC058170]|uniref:SRPBCC family protein n=1 Tax=Kitasatospora sp. NPDC058170 TaxID=3346364 RepID=UPI0036DAD3A0